MADPVSWYLIEQGWEVVGSDGETIGKIEETVGDSTRDIFDGLTVGTGLLSKPRYVPAELVGEIVEGRVALTIDKERFERLDEYQEPPPAEQVEAPLADRARELAGDLLRVRRTGGDHEARVVAGERADDLRMLEPVERAGDRRGRAELGMDDDDVLRDGGAEAELRQHRASDSRGSRREPRPGTT